MTTEADRATIDTLGVPTVHECWSEARTALLRAANLNLADDGQREHLNAVLSVAEAWQALARDMIHAPRDAHDWTSDDTDEDTDNDEEDDDE